MERLTQQLGEKLEQAMEELRHHPVKVKVREKQLEYDASSSKLVWEELREWEITEMEEGDIDVDNLKKLTSSIKDWCSMHPESTAEQREAHLQQLLRELSGTPPCQT